MKLLTAEKDTFTALGTAQEKAVVKKFGVRKQTEQSFNEDKAY